MVLFFFSLRNRDKYFVSGQVTTSCISKCKCFNSNKFTINIVLFKLSKNSEKAAALMLQMSEITWLDYISHNTMTFLLLESLQCIASGWGRSLTEGNADIWRFRNHCSYIWQLYRHGSTLKQLKPTQS